ncbi:MAG: spherulation-specific family 4 protein [Intrasporangiaceae bacterium]|nr:spherulation-specific family 4 protein [Intrasporangiaceae bacterium]
MGAAAPFYLHPAAEPVAWRALLGGRLDLDWAVVNVADGPGGGYDEHYYGPALAGGCLTPLVGYVDLAYGRRPLADVLDDVAAWPSWYGVRDVLLDCTPAEDVADVLATVTAVRAAGAARVVLNPGRVPDPAIQACGDVTCVIETDWRTYPTLDHAAGPGVTWHLVHSVPATQLAAAWASTVRRGADHAWVTDGRLPNPWRVLPTGWGP